MLLSLDFPSQAPFEGIALPPWPDGLTETPDSIAAGRKSLAATAAYLSALAQRDAALGSEAAPNTGRGGRAGGNPTGAAARGDETTLRAALQQELALQGRVRASVIQLAAMQATPVRTFPSPRCTPSLRCVLSSCSASLRALRTRDWQFSSADCGNVRCSSPCARPSTQAQLARQRHDIAEKQAILAAGAHAPTPPLSPYEIYVARSAVRVTVESPWPACEIALAVPHLPLQRSCEPKFCVHL